MNSIATSLGLQTASQATPQEKVDGKLCIQLSTENLNESQNKKIQTEICEMIQKTLTAKIEGFEKSLKAVASGIVEQVNTNLTNEIQSQMLIVINRGFNDKLDQFYKQVNETLVNESLIDKIIFDIGLKLDDALIEKKDSGNAEIYEQHAKTKEGEEGTPRNGGRKTKRNLMRKTKRNLMRKTKRSKV